MIRIERISENIAALDTVILANLLAPRFLVMATRAQRGEFIERRVRLTARLDGDLVVDNISRLDPPNLKAKFTQRFIAQLKLAEALPTLRRVRPLGHLLTR